MEQWDVEGRIKRLEMRIAYLTIFSGVLVIAAGIAALSVFSQKVKAAETPQILRVKGIIVEDAQGRSRILIGSPVPAVPDRLRQDSRTSSIVFLDGQGHDRFLLGQMISSRPSFHRIAAAWGLNIYDPEGNERGGMGFLSNGTTVSRAIITLDRAPIPSAPPDAWGAMVDDKTDFAGTGYMYGPKIGDGNEVGILIGTEGRKAFVRFRDANNKERSSFAVEPDGTTDFRLHGSKGEVGPNLPPSGKLAHPSH